MHVLLPSSGKLVPCHATHGKYAISNEHGLVLIGFRSSIAKAGHKHAILLPLAPRPNVIHWPMRGMDGFETAPDMVLDLQVDRVSIVQLFEPAYGDASEALPGSLFIDDRGTFVVGKRVAAQAPNMFDLETHEAFDTFSGKGLIVNRWKLAAHRGQEKVFEVELSST